MVCFVLQCDTFVLFVFPDEPRQNRGRALVDRKHLNPPTPPPPLSSNFIPGRPKASLLFWFFGDLYAAYCYLWLFSLYVNIKKVKIVVKC